MRFLSLYAASGKGSGQGSDAGKDLGEKLPRDGHLRHLEDCPAGMAYDPCADLDQLELDAAERPARYLPGEGKAPEEISQVVGEDKESQPHLVGDKARTGEARPGKGMLALLDILFA